VLDAKNGKTRFRISASANLAGLLPCLCNPQASLRFHAECSFDPFNPNCSLGFGGQADAAARQFGPD
jgi:hypothetical protein